MKAEIKSDNCYLPEQVPKKETAAEFPGLYWLGSMMLEWTVTCNRKVPGSWRGGRTWERGTAALSVLLHDLPRAVLNTRGGNAAKGL